VRVDVLCFGVLKDFFGGERDLVELADHASVADLLRLLEGRGRRDEAVWKTLAVAVNREYAGLETKLKDGDEVALLPPVSGGCFAGRVSDGPLSEVCNPTSAKRPADMGHPEEWGVVCAR
jgi:molybdopterin converting factor small subunit